MSVDPELLAAVRDVRALPFPGPNDLFRSPQFVQLVDVLATGEGFAGRPAFTIYGPRRVCRTRPLLRRGAQAATGGARLHPFPVTLRLECAPRIGQIERHAMTGGACST